MPPRLPKRLKLLPPDTFDGKTITFADTDVVDAYPQIAVDFMSRIFDFNPGDYLITDESTLLDFAPFDASDTAEIWTRIENTYGIVQSDVGSELLIRVFDAILKRRSTQ